MRRVGCIALRPLYASRNLRRAVVVDEALPTATMYSCSAVRGAVGACVAVVWRRCVSQQGTRGSSCASHAATRPMVKTATADASAVRSAGLYCLSPVVSRARCLQAAVQATAPQFVQSRSAPSAPLLPLCCTVQWLQADAQRDAVRSLGPAPATGALAAAPPGRALAPHTVPLANLPFKPGTEGAIRKSVPLPLARGPRNERNAPCVPPGTGGAAQKGSIPAGLAPLAPLWAPLGTGSPHPMAPAHPGALAAPADPAAMPMRDG